MIAAIAADPVADTNLIALHMVRQTAQDACLALLIVAAIGQRIDMTFNQPVIPLHVLTQLGYPRPSCRKTTQSLLDSGGRSLNAPCMSQPVKVRGPLLFC
jgi:hypothetical protein